MERSAGSEDYVLRGGRQGADRLRILNRVTWPTTEPLLEAAGLRAAMRCLDVGCGGGDAAIGVRLLGMALEAGLEEVRVGLVVPSLPQTTGR